MAGNWLPDHDASIVLRTIEVNGGTRNGPRSDRIGENRRVAGVSRGVLYTHEYSILILVPGRPVAQPREFDTMNETDVREMVVRPLIEGLG